MRHALFAGLLLATAVPNVDAQPEDAETPWSTRRSTQVDPFEPLAPPEPARIVVQVGLGTSLRPVQNVDFEFSQGLFAPGFLDGHVAYVLPTAAAWRHGFGVDISVGLTGDGNVLTGVDGLVEILTGQAVQPPNGPQMSIAPTYRLYRRLEEDWVLGARAAMPVNVTPNLSPGLELSGQVARMLTAGLGPYAELGASAWLGSSGTVHPLLSVEVGLLLDYEVLP
ncbi:MAG: hypothetical protein NZ898_03520 [Myxococcota bacterium]|nr:hypothetical protein [Myxococcota bacterium]MDW8361177.1 hypothetical protein [Myxococcales bacterium]